MPYFRQTAGYIPLCGGTSLARWVLEVGPKNGETYPFLPLARIPGKEIFQPAVKKRIVISGVPGCENFLGLALRFC